MRARAASATLLRAVTRCEPVAARAAAPRCGGAAAGLSTTCGLRAAVKAARKLRDAFDEKRATAILPGNIYHPSATAYEHEYVIQEPNPLSHGYGDVGKYFSLRGAGAAEYTATFSGGLAGDLQQEFNGECTHARPYCAAKQRNKHPSYIVIACVQLLARRTCACGLRACFLSRI